MTGARVVLVVLAALAVAAANFVVAERLGAASACGPCLAWLAGGPLLLAAALTLMLGRTARPPAAAAAAPPPVPSEPRENAALHLLCLLQEEGRFVDFLQEDLASYPDEQVGAAVRGIHEGCRKALAERVSFEAIFGAAEGATVTVEPGFDPASVRLTGNVHGAPPFRGILRHPGWRATRASLPARRGQDPSVIAPAEVEIA